MISQTAEYALRAVVHLGYVYPNSCTTQQVATATKVPPHYLAKVLRDLARARLVRSQRGLRGGFALRRSPAELTVFDVLEAVDPPLRIHECPLGLRAHAHQLCPLHSKLDHAMAKTEEAFRSTTIADVTAPGPRQPLREVATTLTISPGLAPGRNGKHKKRKRAR